MPFPGRGTCTACPVGVRRGSGPARFVALVCLLAVLAAVCVLALAALAPSTGLNNGLTAARMAAATIGATLLALTFAAIAFAIGAATGNRPAAAGAAAALAVVGYVLEGLAQQIPALHPTRPVNPWHWLLASDPIRHGLTWQAWLPPLVATAVLVAAGLPRPGRRDLH